MRRDVIVLTALCLAALLPFINKPFHIDDPMYIWPAMRILDHPLDPYGFRVTWAYVELPMAQVMKNPPGVCYYLALAGAIAGFNEVALHVAMLLPAVLTVLGTYVLARELGARPVLAAGALLATPAFLVSATTLMSDVPMVCLYVWAVFCWVRGMRRGNMALLCAAALLAALSALTKYFAISLIPLFLADGLLRRRTLGRWALPILIPIVLLALYQLATQHLYGRGLLLDAMSYSTTNQDHPRHGRGLVRLLVGLAFTGGCMAPIAFLWLAAAPLRAALSIAGAASATLALMVIVPGVDETIRSDGAETSGVLLQFVTFAGAGIALLVLSGNRLWRVRRGEDLRDPDVILLAFWIAGTFVFAAVVNWNVAVRSLLPLAPAAAIVASLAWRGRSMFWAWPALVVGGALALAVAAADASLARSQRYAADHIMSDPRVRQAARVWFSGRWGFQYYIQRRGAVPLQRGEWNLAAGDVVVIPKNNTLPIYLPAEARSRQLMMLELPLLPGVATMRFKVAGFYSDIWGPLPFALGTPEVEKYAVLVLEEPLISPAPQASETAPDPATDTVPRFHLRADPRDDIGARNQLPETVSTVATANAMPPERRPAGGVPRCGGRAIPRARAPRAAGRAAHQPM